jgi:hypothetical protein
MDTLYTSRQIAAELGISMRRVQELAKSRKLGRMIGRDILFTPADLDSMRSRVTGRPGGKMRDAAHYRDMLNRNPNASVGFTLAAAAVYTAKYGICEAEQHSTPEFREIALSLKRKYGETLTADEVREEMDHEPPANNRAPQGC